MRKYLLGSLFSLFVASSVFSAPSLVNGIAFFVNGNPVTLLDVYKVQQRDKVEQNIAVDILINEKLHEEEIKKHNIIVTELELSDELNSIAKQNKTTSTQLESYIRTNGGNWESYKDEIKKRILKRKLYQIISQESLKMVNEDELRNYYNAHKEEFSIPQSIDVKKFFSKEGAALETLVKSGGKTIPKGIGQENEVLQIAALNPQIVPAFVQGKVGTFTPIYPVGEDFITFLIEAKNNPSLAPFENVRDIILQKIMSQKEDYLIYEEFEVDERLDDLYDFTDEDSFCLESATPPINFTGDAYVKSDTIIGSIRRKILYVMASRINTVYCITKVFNNYISVDFYRSENIATEEFSKLLSRYPDANKSWLEKGEDHTVDAIQLHGHFVEE